MIDTLFIDTEFNDFGGELISIALIDSQGREFYEAIEHSPPRSKWVEENVIPYLIKEPISKHKVQLLLQEFLRKYTAIHIIADWPEDIQHFCDLLITGPGERIDTPKISLEINSSISSSLSKVPHNALYDARALQLDWIAQNKYKY
jgi:hypothetical protein